MMETKYSSVTSEILPLTILRYIPECVNFYSLSGREVRAILYQACKNEKAGDSPRQFVSCGVFVPGGNSLKEILITLPSVTTFPLA